MPTWYRPSWGTGFWFALAVVAVLLASTTQIALAYRESSSTVDPSATQPWECPTCHGLESGDTSPTVAATRRGPHGNYQDGSAKCTVCHAVHYADEDGVLLLAADNSSDACLLCHDGTGGGGVYGVIERLVPGAQPSGHRIGFSQEGSISVPGGALDGSDAGIAFSGPDGSLGCVDCHSVHGAVTVAPFVGDRMRTTADTAPAAASDRLIRQAPGGLDTTVTAYGSEWCAACHRGLALAMANHPVAGSETTTPAAYASVSRMEAYDSTAVAAAFGPLGGSNLGYIVPYGSGRVPICQQCHEDARSIGNSQPGSIVASEAFAPAVDGDGSGNPAFQNFPHESLEATLLIEPRGSLCYNCHSTVGEGPVH